MAREESGVALLTVVVVLAILGGLVSLVFSATLWERRLSGARLRHLQSRMAARSTVAAPLDWSTERFLALLPGDSVLFTEAFAGGWGRGVLTRVSNRFYQVRGEGYSAGARHPDALWVELRDTLGLTAEVVTGAAVATPTTHLVADDTLCNRTARISERSLTIDSSVGSLLAVLDGLAGWRDVAAGPLLAPGPVVVAGVCQVAPGLNWGDPAGGSCGGHFPAMRLPISSTLAGGVGQGALLVIGDLRITGSFRYHGLLAVRGKLVLLAPEIAIMGAVVAGEVVDSSGSAGARLVASACHLSEGLVTFGIPRPVLGHLPAPAP